MHILFDSHGLDEFGQSEVFTSFLAVRGATEYAKVSVVVPARWLDSVPSLADAGVNLIPVPYDNRAFPSNISLEYMYWLYSRRALKAALPVLGTVDLVHRLNPMAVRYVSSLAFAGKPFVVGPLGWSRLPAAWAATPAGVARNVLKATDRLRTSVPVTRLHRMYAAADAIALGSNAALEAFPKSLHPKCTFLGEAIETTAYPVMPAPDNPEPAVLFVGRLVPYKGIEYLVDALSAIRDSPWRLRIVGEGSLKPALEARVGQAGVSDRVEFVGWVPRSEMLAQYARADICCFPGVNESGGNVSLEAMACARPVVVADWAGPRDSVSHECGIRVPVGSITELTRGLEEALRRLLTSPELRRAMGAAGRRRVISRHDTSAVMRRYRELHERIAGPGR